MSTVEVRRIFVEGPSGRRFQAEVPSDMRLNTLAADFFEDQGWEQHDSNGHGQRVVVELVHPDNPDETKRLNGEQEVGKAGLRDGDTLRIFPEAMVGAVDQRDRLRALMQDHNEMQDLCERDPRVSFTANRSHAPDRYEVTLRYPGFKELPRGQSEPTRTDLHQVEITLGNEYPRFGPELRWLTPIFHPNIRTSDGAVCIGDLKERYVPGMGLARLVRMLIDVVQYRNFNPDHGLNEQARLWARDPENWPHIVAIGGYPFQGMLAQILQTLDRSQRKPITFTPV